MARAVTQTVAWGIAIASSLLVFGALYGVVSATASKKSHDGHAKDGPGSDEAHKSADDHAAPGDSHGKGHDAHAAPDHAAPSHDSPSHAAGGHETPENGASAHVPANHDMEAAGHAPAKTEGNSHGEEEISADQFKKGSPEPHAEHH